jgi:hypothetical protein
MGIVTRDDPEYWNHKPDDHNDVGLFAIGPQESRPSLFREIETGDANRAPETETRDAILAREAEHKRARLRRMGLGMTGAFTGRNRRKAA